MSSPLHRLLAFALLSCSGFPALAVDWYSDSFKAPTGTPFAVGALALDRSTAPGRSAAWGALPDVALADGESVTLTATIRFDVPPGASSAGELRFGLLGAPRQSGPGYQSQLRGLVIAGGLRDDRWITQVWERTGDTPFPCAFTNKRVVAAGRTEEPAGTVQAFRLVATIKRHAARRIDVSGFYGPHAFNFTNLELERELSLFNCVAFLSGGKSGVARIDIENVRVAKP